VERRGLPGVRLAWLDCRPVEHECPLDDVGGVYGAHDGDECGYDDGEWHGGHDDRVWSPGCGRECADDGESGRGAEGDGRAWGVGGCGGGGCCGIVRG
jgi:hypothetical protein